MIDYLVNSTLHSFEVQILGLVFALLNCIKHVQFKHGVLHTEQQFL